MIYLSRHLLSPIIVSDTAARRPLLDKRRSPDDLVIKIKELREITDWDKPIYVKVGATRTFNDVKLAVHAGVDVLRNRLFRCDLIKLQPTGPGYGAGRLPPR